MRTLTTTLLVFDVRGTLAHFRRPDTAVTHSTYPFLTRTALRGLLGAILGTEPLREGWTAIELRAPVRTRTQQLSMLGKMYLDGSSTKTFHRPTAVELVIRPHYRVYYTGPQQAELAAAIRRRKSVYPTYLGVAYALTVPEYVGEWEAEPVAMRDGEVLTCRSVVPVAVVKRLEPLPDAEYARVGGLLYEMVGPRQFHGGVSVLYNAAGGPIRFVAQPAAAFPPVQLVRLKTGEHAGEVVALW